MPSITFTQAPRFSHQKKDVILDCLIGVTFRAGPGPIVFGPEYKRTSAFTLYNGYHSVKAIDFKSVILTLSKEAQDKCHQIVNEIPGNSSLLFPNELCQYHPGDSEED